MTTITDLPQLISQLAPSQRARMDRLFRIDISEGRCVVPDTMREWVIANFGSIDRVEHQQIVRVTNLITWDGAIYNPVRSGRPIVHVNNATARPTDGSFDIFADPLNTTAADVFGRVRGRHCITTGNIARWEGQHAVVIFDEYDPLRFERDHMRDYFQTSLEWARQAHAHDPQARYFYWGWNGGLKGGASIPHAHAQVGLARHQHYAQVEGLRRAALGYRQTHGGDYFADLLAAHQALGLAFEQAGLPGFIYLSAWRAKDVWLYGRAFDDTLADALCDTLRILIDQTGIGAFNVGVVMPPLFDGSEAQAEDWDGFPVIARIVDRGSPTMLSSDVGSLDIFAHQVIAMDPYSIIDVLQ